MRYLCAVLGRWPVTVYHKLLQCSKEEKQEKVIESEQRMKSILTVILPVMLFSASALAQRSDPIERCESVPLPGHQVSMRVDGIEKVWNLIKIQVQAKLM